MAFVPFDLMLQSTNDKLNVRKENKIKNVDRLVADCPGQVSPVKNFIAALHSRNYLKYAVRLNM